MDLFVSIKQTERGCMEWPISRQPSGYGQMTIDAVPATSHRLAWRVFKGEIPVGMSVLHRCDNPPCCNPEHLWLGTDADNIADMHRKGRYSTANRAHGARHGMTSLTEDQVMEIRASRGSEVMLAGKYGVCSSTIHNIRRGKTWKHFGSSAGSTAKDQTIKRALNNGG